MALKETYWFFGVLSLISGLKHLSSSQRPWTLTEFLRVWQALLPSWWRQRRTKYHTVKMTWRVKKNIKLKLMTGSWKNGTLSLRCTCREKIGLNQPEIIYRQEVLGTFSEVADKEFFQGNTPSSLSISLTALKWGGRLRWKKGQSQYCWLTFSIPSSGYVLPSSATWSS